MVTLFQPLALRWLKRSGEEGEVRDQFLSSWTAFQALYGSCPELKESEKIVRTVDLLTEEEAKNLLALSEVDYFVRLNPSVRYHDGRTGQLKTTEHQQAWILQRREGEPKAALEAVMDILHKIRLNIFSSGPDAVTSEAWLSNAVPIVRGVVEVLSGK